MYQDRLKRESNEILLNERVESQLEREEKEWEEKMQTREQRVAELEVELKAFQEGDDAVLSSENHDEDAGDISTEEKEDQDDVSDDEASEGNDQASKAMEMREALALRMEEKRDIDAAIRSLKRKKRQRSFQAEQRAQEGESLPTSENERELLQELLKLREKKDALQLQIITSEEENELLDGHQADISKLKAAIGENKEQRVAAQDRLEEVKHALNRLKAKMKHMVDVQILTARDTIPSTLREEAVILHLLYQHEGEMGVNELKQETAEILASHGKASSNGMTIRALYSLVANGVVQIDRSYGNGLVTSLLV
uniref:Uncharacterized protein n=1 Tax=Globisporangium ultimum (strain ATCC 200006 / CBS 805.95 / DAOM BR144) TaxID=431595 RepID=K3WXU4_GLOUD